MDSFLNKYRVFAGNSPRTPQVGIWSYDMGENCQIQRKLQLLEEKAGDGRCYLRLLLILPVFDRIKFELFERVVDYFAEDAGQYPVGKDLMVRLASLNILVESEKFDGQPVDEEAVFNPEIFDQMMMNRHRFSFTENGGIMHVESCTYRYDNPVHRNQNEALVTDEGVSSRYMVIMLGASNKLVGGEVYDLNEIFGNLNEDDATDLTMSPTEFQRLRPTESLINEIEDYQRKIVMEPVEEVEENDSLKNDSMMSQTILDQHDMIHRLKQQLDLKDKKYQNARSALKKFVQENQSDRNSMMSIQDTITANDSASNVGIMHKRPKSKTVISTTFNGRRTVDNLVEVDDLNVQKQVIIGFRKTDSMQKVEKERNSKVTPINGLANPFRNDRLNLLVHFHTAVQTNLPIDNDQGYATSLKRILKYKSRSPSEELSRQIIETTFDFESLAIVANPFLLPFIEVGMSISDNCLISCFTLLRSEFEMLWFNSMKSLLIPDFHKKFRNYSETVVSGSSRGQSDTGKSTDSSGSRGKSRSRRTSSKSLFLMN